MNKPLFTSKSGSIVITDKMIQGNAMGWSAIDFFVQEFEAKGGNPRWCQCYAYRFDGTNHRWLWADRGVAKFTDEYFEALKEDGYQIIDYPSITQYQNENRRA